MFITIQNAEGTTVMIGLMHIVKVLPTDVTIEDAEGAESEIPGTCIELSNDADEYTTLPPEAVQALVLDAMKLG